eukprot:4056134-Pyramimonas_sp.AAC.1
MTARRLRTTSRWCEITNLPITNELAASSANQPSLGRICRSRREFGALATLSPCEPFANPNQRRAGLDPFATLSTVERGRSGLCCGRVSGGCFWRTAEESVGFRVDFRDFM